MSLRPSGSTPGRAAIRSVAARRERATSTAGVQIQSGATNNRVGTDGNGVADTAERNVISGNTSFGVLITGSGTTGNVVAGDFIGTNTAGTARIANGTGVQIQSGAAGNRVGT